MKILIINDRGTRRGGAENYTFNLMEAFQSRGYDVRFFSPSAHDTPEWISGGIAGYLRRVLKEIRGLFSLITYLQLRKVVRDFMPDAVYIQMFILKCSPSILYALPQRIAVITIHDYGCFCPVSMKYVMCKSEVCTSPPGKACLINKCVTRPGLLVYFIRRWILNRRERSVRWWLAPSTYAAGLLRDSGTQNYRIIPYGFDIERYQCISPLLRQGSERILFLGRIDESKGALIVLHAFHSIRREFPNALLHLVGEGSQRRKLERTVEEMGITPYVIFQDWVTPDKVPELHKTAHLLVVPSLWPDNLPLVICEAMLLGTPVIASRVGGIPDLLGEFEECMFTQGDIMELSQKMRMLLGDRELAARISRRAREKAESMLDMKNHISSLIELYSVK